MAPRRHDDKRRTTVRTRGAGPREGAVKGPAPISLVYRDSRGVEHERACAERDDTPTVPSPSESLVSRRVFFCCDGGINLDDRGGCCY